MCLAQVNSLIEAFLEQARTIILCVIPANQVIGLFSNFVLKREGKLFFQRFSSTPPTPSCVSNPVSLSVPTVLPFHFFTIPLFLCFEMVVSVAR